MTIEKIKILLEKYFEGETTLEEERFLNEYFNNSEVPIELKSYQPLFQFFKGEKDIRTSDALDSQIANISPTKKPSPVLTFLKGGLKWRAAAAVLIIGGAVFLINKQFNPTVKTSNCVADNCRVKVFDENSDPEKAYAEVQAALKLVSKKMKKGTDETQHGLKKVKMATDEVDKYLPSDSGE